MLLEVGVAVGFIVHAGKPKVLDLSTCSDFSLRRELADIPMASPLDVARGGVYLGVPLGVGSLGK